MCLCDRLQLTHQTFVHCGDVGRTHDVEAIEQELHADGVLTPSIIEAFIVLYRVVRTG